MKTLLLSLILAFTFTAVPVFADELPEIAPVEDPAVPPLDAPTE